MKTIFHGTITDLGKFSPDRLKDWLVHIAKLKGNRVSLTIEKFKAKKSHPQRRYYFGVIVAMLADYCGYTVDEMHEALKWRFLRVHGESGLPDKVRSTESLNTAECEQYHENIRRWALTEHALRIPLPGEVEY